MAAFHHSSFSFGKDSHLLIAIPGKLQNYDLEKLFAKNQILCLDEADSLLSGAENVITKQILRSVQQNWRFNKKQVAGDSLSGSEVEGSTSCRSSDAAPRVIVTAATLPSRGPANVGMQVLRLFPRNSVTFLKTENTHKILPMAELTFTPCKDRAGKFSRLIEDLDALLTGSRDTELPKVLIFANTVKTATTLSNFLNQPYSDVSLSLDSHSKWWLGRVGSFFKQSGVFNEQREQVLKDFRRGSLRVMVCSDLGSRGLDFPDCTAVIQFDFPENSEHFLHRAGRTARAGRSGKGKS